MSDKAATPSETIRLHRLTPGRPIAAFEIPRDQFTQFAPERPVTAAEISRLIEGLLQQLPEPERQAIDVKIRADGMI